MAPPGFAPPGHAPDPTTAASPYATGYGAPGANPYAPGPTSPAADPLRSLWDAGARGGRATGKLLDRFRGVGTRVEGRPTPRFSVLLSVAGVLLVLGGMWWVLVGGGPVGLAVVGSFVLTAAGYAAVWILRDGPLATAGATASAVGLPFFLVPVAAEVGAAAAAGALLLCFVLWLAAYFVGPGRGHVVYLGMPMIVAAGIVFTILAVVFTLVTPTVGVLWAAIWVTGWHFGMGFLLDRARLSGLATAFTGLAVVMAIMSLGWVWAAVVVTGVGDAVDGTGSSGSSTAVFGSSSSSGSDEDLRFFRPDGDGMFSSSSSGSEGDDLFSVGDDFKPISMLLPGLFVAAGGVAVLRYGVGSSRRATSWTGAGAITVGAWCVAYAITGTNATALGIVAILGGATLIAAGHLLASRIGEADEMAATPSFADVGLLSALRSGAGAVSGRLAAAAVQPGTGAAIHPGMGVHAAGFHPGTPPSASPVPTGPYPGASAHPPGAPAHSPSFGGPGAPTPGGPVWQGQPGGPASAPASPPPASSGPGGPPSGGPAIGAPPPRSRPPHSA